LTRLLLVWQTLISDSALVSALSPAQVAELRLGPDRASGALARHFTTDVLALWAYEGRHDDVVLVVSELVTNAVRHGQGAPALRMSGTPTHVRIEVTDDDPTLPKPGTPRPTGGGWGLNLVQTLAADWGAARRNGGKVVWCEMTAGRAGAPDLVEAA
jgi:anti-sigma regulatory factor (Ser/Thr protein kinase)